jgi:rod shape determining protein RodA
MDFFSGRLIFTRLVLLAATLCLLVLGLATIYAYDHPAYRPIASANPDLASTSEHKTNWNIEQWASWDQWQKQFSFAVLSLGAMAVVNLFSYRRLGPISYAIYGIALLMLAYVLLGRWGLVPFVPYRNGSYRWIQLPGLPQIQPSEFARLAYIIALAWYLRYRGNYSRFGALIGPFVLAVFAMILILKEPDLGTVLLLIAVLFTMLFVAGAKGRHIVAIILLGVAAMPFLWSQMESYQRQRIATVILQSEWVRQEAQQHPTLAQALVGKPTIGQIDKNEGWQLLQSKLAIASGGTYGNGFRQGPYVQYNILPFRDTDFIFSIYAHQFGFVGSMLLLGLYVVLIACAIEIAARNSDPFGRLMAVGIAAMFAVQIIVNIAMTVGLLPCKGVALPFMSYGGSSLLTCLTAIGLLNNIGRCRPFTLSTTPSN